MAVDDRLEQMRQQLEAGKIQFQAAVDAMKQQKDHQQDTANQILEMANQQRQLMLEKLGELRLQADQKVADQEGQIIQGKIDAMLEGIKQLGEHQRTMMEIAAAEREQEVVQRDEKGKVKKTVSRIKK
jgi:hypothetical protein